VTILSPFAEIALRLMKEGAMMTVLSTLVAALALPATLVTASDLIDSKWAIAVDRLVFIVLFFW
jgi:hypothetical protein